MPFAAENARGITRRQQDRIRKECRIDLKFQPNQYVLIANKFAV
jgi:hypothetical protein